MTIATVVKCSASASTSATVVLPGIIPVKLMSSLDYGMIHTVIRNE